MGWTQAICVACWNERNPDRPTNPAISYEHGDEECCCHCGQATRSGIYVRVNPATVPYPQEVT
jgi:hypothetical protein